MAIMIKTTMTKSLFRKFIILDFIVVLFCILSDNYTYLINTQVAFISSMLVSFATFYSYKNNVLKQVDSEIQKQETDLDYVDKIDDPYDLYSDNINEKIIKNPNKEQIQEAMKPIKQNYFSNFRKTILSYASFYRIFAYVLLIFGFFYLNNNNFLHIYSYLFGFLIIPISSLFAHKQA